MNRKHHWLDIAETIDSLRVFPRLFLAACFLWTIEVSWQLLAWYVRLPATERTAEASGFGAVVFLTVSGFLKFVFDTYTRGGRDWNGVTNVVQATTTTTSVTAPSPTPTT